VKPTALLKILYSISYADVRPTFVVEISAQYQQAAAPILALVTISQPKGKKSSVKPAIDSSGGRNESISPSFGQ